ncbi:hypothetical protein LXL04_031352 [Taraxacum kok-saghyz]
MCWATVVRNAGSDTMLIYVEPQYYLSKRALLEIYVEPQDCLSKRALVERRDTPTYIATYKSCSHRWKQKESYNKIKYGKYSGFNGFNEPNKQTNPPLDMSNDFNDSGIFFPCATPAMPFSTSFLKFLGPTPGIVNKSGFPGRSGGGELFCLLFNLVDFTSESDNTLSASPPLSFSLFLVDTGNPLSDEVEEVRNQDKREPLRFSLSTTHALSGTAVAFSIEHRQIRHLLPELKT